MRSRQVSVAKRTALGAQPVAPVNQQAVSPHAPDGCLRRRVERFHTIEFAVAFGTRKPPTLGETDERNSLQCSR